MLYASATPETDAYLPDLFLPGLGDEAGDLSPIVRRPRPRVATPGVAVLLRAGLAFLAFAAVGAFAFPAMAEPAPRPGVAGQPAAMAPVPAPIPAPRLRGDVTARGDTLTLGDLVEGAPAALERRPLFRSPALGATGTIQAARIVDAAAALGVQGVETGGRLQIGVQRAARRVGTTEIEAAFKRGLEAAYGLNPLDVAIRFEGEGPALLAPLDLAGQAAALDLTYDPRSRRVGGLVSLGERQASLRVTGTVIELREVAVLTRALDRGEAIRAGDVALERRPRESVPADAQGGPQKGSAGGSAAPGEVAQRPLGAGTVLRAGDTVQPELVARGDNVTIVYEAPGISLAMRGQASEGGRMGATVTVVNSASKKVLQATVIGPGRVSVGPAAPQLQATASLR